MAQSYRIYIKESVLIIAESMPQLAEAVQQINQEEFDFAGFFHRVKNDPVRAVYVVLTSNAKRLFKNIRKSLQLVKAAGGIVRNEENKYLFIFRKGKWDLPKGKLDEKEKNRKAAVREVEEECGISVKESGKKICKTYHAYEENGQLLLKKTNWYWMMADSAQVLAPQTEEGITDVRWFAPSELNLVRSNTYLLISDLLNYIDG